MCGTAWQKDGGRAAEGAGGGIKVKELAATSAVVSAAFSAPPSRHGWSSPSCWHIFVISAITACTLLSWPRD
jgi:hypothetical protein